VGAALPILFYAPTGIGIVMTAMGVLLTIIFVAIAMFAAVITRDKAKGIGISIFLWLFFALLFDGIILFILFQFQDYPLEKFMIIASACNPIDLSRIMILLKMDISALMGFTGAVFRDFFGSQSGFVIAIGILLSWIIIVFWLSLRKFDRKDL
jgi:Cu-processing system permease protein